MDYANGTVFDSDPSLLQINGHPLLGIKCYTTTAGRGTAVGLNQLPGQDNSCKNIGNVNSSAVAGQTESFSDEIDLSQQIQRASGISYSNHAIENYFCDMSREQKDFNQFEDIDETSNADPSMASKPIVQSSTKRKHKRREFRKLDISSSVSGSIALNSSGWPAGKKLGDVFKQHQTFDPDALMKETMGGRVRVRLGSKNDFPSL